MYLLFKFVILILKTNFIYPFQCFWISDGTQIILHITFLQIVIYIMPNNWDFLLIFTCVSEMERFPKSYYGFVYLELVDGFSRVYNQRKKKSVNCKKRKSVNCNLSLYFGVCVTAVLPNLHIEIRKLEVTQIA